MKYTDQVLEIAHDESSYHRLLLKSSKICGCFYCLTAFKPYAIHSWIDNSQTALCPNCGIDSVLGDASNYPITHDFMSQMQAYWFKHTPNLPT